MVDLFAPAQSHPAVINGNWDVWALRDRVLFQDKAEYDERSARSVNRYIEFARDAQRLLKALPTSDGYALNSLKLLIDGEATTLRDRTTPSP